MCGRDAAARDARQLRDRRLPALARRTDHSRRLGQRADLPPLLHHALLPFRRTGTSPHHARDRLHARRIVLARRPSDRLFEPQRPVALRHRNRERAPNHAGRRLEPHHQRHDRLGLRGGVRLHQSLRLLSRQPPDRLPAFRRERGPRLRNDAFRRQTLQRSLHLQIPQGRRTELHGGALALRHRHRRPHAHRHRRRDRSVHPPFGLDPRRAALLLPRQPPPKPVRGGAVRRRRIAAHDLRRTLSPLRGARTRLDRNVPRRGPLRRHGGDLGRAHAPLFVQHRRGSAPPHHPRRLGGYGNRRPDGQTHLLPLDRGIAPAPRPLQHHARRTQETAPHGRRRLLHDRPKPRHEILHFDLLQCLDPQPRRDPHGRGQAGPHAPHERGAAQRTGSLGAPRQGVHHDSHRTGRHAECMDPAAARIRSVETLSDPHDPVFGSGFAAGRRPLVARLGGCPRRRGLCRGLRRRTRHGLPRRSIQEMHLRTARAARSRGSALRGPLPRGAAVGRSRTNRHLRLVLRRFHGAGLRAEGRRALQDGDRRGSRYLMAVLRLHLYRDLQRTAAGQPRGV